MSDTDRERILLHALGKLEDEVEEQKRELRQCHEELRTTKAVLGDLLEERGLPREPMNQYLFVEMWLSNYDQPLTLVIQASSELEAEKYVRAYGEEFFPNEVWERVAVQALPPAHPGVWGSNTDET